MSMGMYYPDAYRRQPVLGAYAAIEFRIYTYMRGLRRCSFLTIRAMPEPQRVGRATGRHPRFLV